MLTAMDSSDPKATADPSAFGRFGPGSYIAEPFTMSCPERIDIGENVYIGPGAWFSVVDEHNERRYEPRIWIGDGASLGPGLVIACIGEISIGPRVLAGPRVFIGDTYHDYRDPDTAVADQPMSSPRPVVIGSGAFLGVGSVILPGVTIGERACIGANAVVTSDVPPNAVVAGVPARVIKRWDDDNKRWIDESRGPDHPSASAPVRDDGRPGSLGGDQLAEAPRERIARLEQQLTVSDSRRAALDEQLRSARREHERLLGIRAEQEDQMHLLRAQHDEALAALERTESARVRAEHWLAEHRRSPSWRITEPLRVAKRLVIKRRPRS